MSCGRKLLRGTDKGHSDENAVKNIRAIFLVDEDIDSTCKN